MNALRPDDLASLAVFVRVAECRGFSAAARRLGLSKAAVSARVSALERALGVALLARTTRSVGLTDAGRRLLAHARQALEEAEAGIAAAREAGAQPSGLVRITAPSAIGRRLLVPEVAPFLAAHPRVALDLMMSDAVLDLAGEGFDLAIRHTASPPETFVAWALRPVAWHLVASPGYLAARGCPEAPRDLAAHDCVFYPREGAGGATWRLRGPDGAVEAVRVAGRFRANDSEALCRVVEDGAGIGLLPDFTCGAALAAGRLVRVLPAHEPEGSFPGGILALRPWSPRVPAAVRAFVEHLRARFGRRRPAVCG